MGTNARIEMTGPPMERPGEARKGWFWRRQRAPREDLPEVSRIWCIALFLLSCAAVAMTAWSGMEFSGKLALTENGKLTLQGWALIIDGFCIALCAISGQRWAGRHWLSSILLLALGGGYLVYSGSGVIGFGIGERVGSAWLAEAKQTEARETVKDENSALLKGREVLLATLKQRYAAARTEREKAIIINQLARAAGKPIELKTAKVETAVANDKAASVFGKALGYDMETVQAVLMAYGGLLIVLGGPIGAWCSTAFWPRKRLRWFGWFRRAPAMRAREEPDDKPAATTPTVTKLDTDPALEVSEVPAIEAPKPVGQAAIDLDNARDRALVREWMDTAMVRVPRTQHVKAETVYGWFTQWCREHKKLTSIMTQTRFGRITAELELPKERFKGRVVYRGIAKAQPAKAVATLKKNAA